MKMIRSLIPRLLNALRIFWIALIIFSMFGNSILRYLDILDPDRIELSERSSENETERETENEKETEETDVDEFINGHLQYSVLDPSKLCLGSHACNLFNSHGEVTTPPPELV